MMEISGFGNIGDLVNMEMECSSFYGGMMSHNLEETPFVYDEYRPVKQMRSWSSHLPTTTATTTTTFQFDHKVVVMKPKEEETGKLADHSLAERKRREKLSQRFVALSALVPGLKKVDKASILEDAIEYMKRLEEKVKELEEKARKRNMESVVFTVNKDNNNDNDDDYFPLIRARFCDKELLISVHCQRGIKGVFEKIVGEIENSKFSVVNSSLMSYGESSLSITLIAQKNEEEEGMNVEQLVRNLRVGLLKIIL